MRKLQIDESMKPVSDKALRNYLLSLSHRSYFCKEIEMIIGKKFDINPWDNTQSWITWAWYNLPYLREEEINVFYHNSSLKKIKYIIAENSETQVYVVLNTIDGDIPEYFCCVCGDYNCEKSECLSGPRIYIENQSNRYSTTHKLKFGKMFKKFESKDEAITYYVNNLTDKEYSSLVSNHENFCYIVYDFYEVLDPKLFSPFLVPRTLIDWTKREIEIKNEKIAHMSKEIDRIETVMGNIDCSISELQDFLKYLESQNSDKKGEIKK